VVAVGDKAQLVNRFAAKQGGAHRYVASDFASAAFTQIVGRQGSVGGPPPEFVDEGRYALRIQSHIVVQKHQPTRSAARFAFIPCPGDRVPAAPIFRPGRTHHAVHDQLNPALTAKPALDFGRERAVVSRQDHQIDNWSHAIRRFRRARSLRWTRDKLPGKTWLGALITALRFITECSGLSDVFVVGDDGRISWHKDDAPGASIDAADVDFHPI
jgi:hypothetical protein